MGLRNKVIDPQDPMSMHMVKHDLEKSMQSIVELWMQILGKEQTSNVVDLAMSINQAATRHGGSNNLFICALATSMGALLKQLLDEEHNVMHKMGWEHEMTLNDVIEILFGPDFPKPQPEQEEESERPQRPAKEKPINLRRHH